MLSAVKSWKDSAQSPACSRKASPAGDLGQRPLQAAGLAGEDQGGQGGQGLERLVQDVRIRPVRLLLGRQVPPSARCPLPIHVPPAWRKVQVRAKRFPWSRIVGLLWAQRIGILGGTFDPIHVGHLVAAVNAKSALGLDRVLMVVANIPWQKAGSRAVSSAEDRLDLVAAAVGGVPGLEASRLEIDRGGESYTADTLAELHEAAPGDELFLIVGWDVVGDLTTWERHEEIKRLATLVVVNRPGAGPPSGLDEAGWRVAEVTVPNLEISSTDLRARAAGGRPLDYLVPEAAVRFIAARGMYAGGG